MARPAVSGVSSDPAQGQVFCNAVIQTGQGATLFCTRSMYHDGKHDAANSVTVGVNVNSN